MLVIYDEVRLDPSMKSIALNDEEWAINPLGHVMHHNPTRTVFQVSIDGRAMERGTATLADFTSRLVEIDRGCALPPPQLVEVLARQSLVLYLVAIGMVTPAIEEAASSPTGDSPQYMC